MISTKSDLQSNLPIIEIITENQQELFEKEYSNGYANFFNEENKAVFLNKSLEIRQRGNGTYLCDKKPYKIKFSESLDMLQDDTNYSTTWVLLADYNDRSLFRNYTALSLANVFDGFEYTIQFRPVEVILNGEHLGTYLLTEQVEVSSSVIDINEKDGDILFERVTENRMKQDYNFSVQGAIRNVVYDIRSEIYSLNQIERAESIVINIEEALNSASKEDILNLIDINSCVDYYILQELMKNLDVGYGSSYMYIYGDSEKLYFSTPWDFDWSAGNTSELDNCGYENLYVGSSLEQYTYLVQTHCWYQRLMQFEWFQEIVIERWNELKPKIESVIYEITIVSEKYEFEFQRNLEIWEIDNISRNERFDCFYDWINNRYNWLDEYFNTK